MFKTGIAAALATVGIVVLLTMIFSFFGVPSYLYMPYIYFLVAVALFALILSPQPASILDPKL
jgi:hypothetical protein